MRPGLRLAIVATAAFFTGAVAAVVLVPDAMEALVSRPVTTVGKAQVGGPFSLVDHTGKAVTDQDFRGRHMIVFFGFTHCPDVCPSGLQVIANALDQLGPRAEQVTPVLITVDPERDTPAQLAEYVKSFHPRLVGLTGTPEQVQAAAKAYRVYYKKVPDPKSAAEYTVDHSSIIYLMDPKGEFVTHFTHGTPAEAIATRIVKQL